MFNDSMLALFHPYTFKKYTVTQLSLRILTLALLAGLISCGGQAEHDNTSANLQPPPALLQPSPPKFGGTRASYTITKSAGGFLVTDKSGVSIEVVDADAIQFDDMRINLRIGEKANSISGENLRALIDLYIAFFNRVPDADGLGYWIDQFKGGMSFDQISQNFYAAALLYSTQTGYDASMSDADFVRVIYKNVLGRSGVTAPPERDVQYWANELKNGRSKGNLISTMLVSARSFTNDPTWGWVPQLLDNKVAVAHYFAVQQGINYNSPEESILSTIAIAAAITPTDVSTTISRIGIVDNTFNLAQDATTPLYTVSIDIPESITVKYQGRELKGSTSIKVTHYSFVSLDATLRPGDIWNNSTGLTYANGKISVSMPITSDRQFSIAIPKPEYKIDTYAGNGALTLGDNGPATNAMLAAPEQVMVATSGTVYITDTNNNRVAQVTPEGIITTFAGRGSAENQSLNNGSPATEAVVRFPRALYETSAGIYIGDHSYTVRHVDKSGTIKHAAIDDRSLFILPFSIALDAEQRIYIADTSHHRVLRAERDGSLTVIAGIGVAGNDGDNGLATAARLNSPKQLYLDGKGNLLIGSPLAPLRSIHLASGIISTKLSQHMGYFDVEASGSFVYSKGSRIARVNPETGGEVTIAGISAAGFSGDGGQASAAQFNDVRGISVDKKSGAIFVADTGNHRIRKISTNGLITTFAGNGVSPSTLDGIPDSQGIGFDKFGNLFSTDFQYHYLRRIDNGRSRVIAGTGKQQTSGDGGSAMLAGFANPSMIHFDRFNQLFFLDLNNSTGSIRMVKSNSGAVLGSEQNDTITTIAGQNLSRDFVDNGTADGGLARNAVFNATRDFAIDSKGNLIIADWLGHRIRKVSPGVDGIFNGSTDEIITTIAGNGASGQSGDNGPALLAAIEGIARLALDKDDNIYIFSGVNTSQPSIRRIDAKTAFITTLSTAIPAVSDMVVTSEGDLIFTDNLQVKKLSLKTKLISVIAGNGTSGFSGDGGNAIHASFRGASYLTLDAQENIYVVDNGNFRIRRITKEN